jgi:hypothetical protein
VERPLGTYAAGSTAYQAHKKLGQSLNAYIHIEKGARELQPIQGFIKGNGFLCYQALSYSPENTHSFTKAVDSQELHMCNDRSITPEPSAIKMPLPTILHFTDAFIRVFMGWKMQKPS